MSATAGWVADHGKVEVSGAGRDEGTVRLIGNTRAYLVEDYSRSTWREHKYARMDLTLTQPLAFRVDLSNVPCGCLACVYGVAMNDPSSFKGSNYCDMGGDRDGATRSCAEVDMMEANRDALQTALHTEAGGSFGSHQCDRIGCFARSGGENAPEARKESYGPGKGVIDSSRPFEVYASVDSASGELAVRLSQWSNGDHHELVTFNRHVGGNPQGTGVPSSAMEATRSAIHSTGGLVLVASLWTSADMSWLSGRSCDRP